MRSGFGFVRPLMQGVGRGAFKAIIVLAACCGLAGALARADSAADEAAFKGKDVTIFIGYSPGGVYDIYGRLVATHLGSSAETSGAGNYDHYGRLVAKHLGQHLPGHPNVVAKNMPGAGSLRLTRFLYTDAPKDGTAIGIVGRGVPFAPLLGFEGADYDPVKFNWLGSANNEVGICAFAHRAGITDWTVLRKKRVNMGGIGPSSDDELYPRIINAIFGTMMKIISGYPGPNDLDFAIERGEIDGRCGGPWSKAKAEHYDLFASGKLDIVLQLALAKHRDLPQVPLLTDIAANAQDRALLEAVVARERAAWPFVAPPGLPAERVKILRDAFAATLADPDFLSEANAIGLPHDFVRGEDIAALIDRVYQLPAADVARLRAILK